MNGLIGFLVVLALLVAALLLFRSMSRHIRNVPRSFEPEETEPPPDEP